MRHERDLARSVLSPKGWVPGLTLGDADLAHVAGSALMIYGNNDPVGPTELWERFVDKMPNATLWVVADSGFFSSRGDRVVGP